MRGNTEVLGEESVKLPLCSVIHMNGTLELKPGLSGGKSAPNCQNYETTVGRSSGAFCCSNKKYTENDVFSYEFMNSENFIPF